MAKNNLPKLKQIQGGLQLRSDVNTLIDRLNNLKASDVATTIVDPSKEGSYLNAAQVLASILSTDDTQNADISQLKTDVENLEKVKINDYVRLTGTIEVETEVVDEITNYNYTATLDLSESLAELKAQALEVNEKCVIYTEDNTVVTDINGVPITLNLATNVISGKMFVADTENTDSDILTYKPIDSNFKFKIFPVGHYTLETIDEDFLLDNEEMKAVYYQNAIDELAFRITKNSSLLEVVKEMIGQKSVTQALADLKAEITAAYELADKNIQDELDALTQTVSDNESDIENKVSAIDSRVTTTENEIATLKGDATTTGSVAKAIKDVTDPLASRITVNENEITTLKGDVNTVGSVAKAIKDAKDEINVTTTNLDNRLTTAENTLTKLEGSSEVEGSVDNKISKAIADYKTTNDAEISTINSRLDTAESDIDNLETTSADHETRLTQAESDIDTLQADVSKNTSDIADIKEVTDLVTENKDSWTNNSSYSNEDPILTKIGGVEVGETFNNVSITDMLTKILYPYVKPEIREFTSTTSGIYETGTVFDTTTLTVAGSQKSRNIQSIKFFVNNTEVNSLTNISELMTGKSFSASFTYEEEINSDTTFKVEVADNKEKSTSQNTVKFYLPAYIGLIPKTTEVNEISIKELTKLIQAPATLSKTFASFTDSRIVVVLPPTWTLSTILDPNSFDVTSVFNQTIISLECLDGINRDFNVYYTDPCDGSGTYKFNKR